MLAFLPPDAFVDILNCAILAAPCLVARTGRRAQPLAPSSLWLNVRRGAMADHDFAPAGRRRLKYWHNHAAGARGDGFL